MLANCYTDIKESLPRLLLNFSEISIEEEVSFWFNSGNGRNGCLKIGTMRCVLVAVGILFLNLLSPFGMFMANVDAFWGNGLVG